jgi:hypothetical protein
MKLICLALTVSLSSASNSTLGEEGLSVKAYRPASSTWKKTMCGSPSGGHPAIPAGKYTIGVDYGGNDMAPCGSKGCVLAANATHDDCMTKCTSTKDCVLYVFATANCSGKAGPICWTKSQVGSGRKSACRNSQILGQPATTQADIPSKWAAQVSGDKTPLVSYPRPQMARGAASSFDELRDNGDTSVWTNLNGYVW